MIQLADVGEAAVVNRYLQRVPVDLDAMAADLGLEVERSPLSENIAGKLVRDARARAGYRIVINSRDSSRRQRFTFAHELAHYMLHRDLVDEVVDNALYRSPNLGDDMERQADRFAAQLLLPANEVRRAYAREKALARLAELFDVSDQALRIRLRELRLAP
ncbi:MAG: ImmA/IrrE family metallo-endopeptidase [Phenylobacterium sp.]|uniref:ImmA/IrrE family metallo-endopeptidase n=1 Tax=Phenylobacterium sp. TaxID=1871053 RepID=UPI002736158D|nr:ImmA/IrrE family metallo-endopeptidase [Phenylobacterium sp.]MDP3117972.1 ImmA/IrrE family metallo-endopeptidase [Phenylobacterium sp.]